MLKERYTGTEGTLWEMCGSSLPRLQGGRELTAPGRQLAKGELPGPLPVVHGLGLHKE